ncbi:hypothetical protein NUSPORA_01826 [Nucleospora cyclopteri]
MYVTKSNSHQNYNVLKTISIDFIKGLQEECKKKDLRDITLMEKQLTVIQLNKREITSLNQPINYTQTLINIKHNYYCVNSIISSLLPSLLSLFHNVDSIVI